MVELHGQKLSGGYALQRISGGDDAKWLLIKLRDAHADARRKPTSTERRSVLSGRTVQRLAKEAAARRDDGARPDAPDRQGRGEE
jgi:hypothetical protein